jgi:hypothetical protein
MQFAVRHINCQYSLLAGSKPAPGAPPIEVLSQPIRRSHLFIAKEVQMAAKTNIGKKDTRQVDRLLTKSVQEGRDRMGGKEVEARLAPRDQQQKLPRTKKKSAVD